MRSRSILLGAGIFGTVAGLASQASLPGRLSGNADTPRIEDSVTYSGCNEVRLRGKAPLFAGQPGYSLDMDGDHDGIACEPHR